MKCSNCEREIPDDAVFCPYCGNEQVYLSDDVGVFTEEVDGDVPVEEVKQENNNSLDRPTDEPLSQTENKKQKAKKEPGLKWYYFIINFQIWLYMLGSFVNGFTYAVGPRFGDWNTTNAVYEKLPTLKSVDVAFGICMFALVVFAFITRRHLAKFLPAGPRYYIALGLSYPVLMIVYAFAASAVSGVEVKYILTSSEISQIVVSVVFVIINVIYFGKRKSYFAPR